MTSVVAGILERDTRLLICQRRAEDAFPLKWEFPGGKVRAGESAAEALHRELREELSIDATLGLEIERLHYRYPAGEEFELIFFAVMSFAGEPRNRAFQDIRWVSRAELPDYDFLEADRALVTRLGEGKSFCPRA